jgi:phosphonate dehydrogenase
VTSKVFPETLDLLSRWGEPVANDSVDPWPREELVRKAADAAALMAFMFDTVDAAFLDACPRLRIVSCALKGYDNFDVAACTRKGVWLTIVPDLLTKPTAELALALMLALSRRLLAGDDQVRAERFAGWRPILYGTSIDDSTVSILGGGAIGEAIAQKLSGFNCQVLVHDQQRASALPPNARWAPMEELIRQGDYLVLALPLLPSTLHIVNESLLDRVKHGCLLVNPARGSLVNEGHVVAALQTGRLGGYAADVYEFEDQHRKDAPGKIHPGLLAMRDKTVLTPHLGSAVSRARAEIEHYAAMNIGEALAGKRPHGAVNQVDVRSS